MEAVPVPGPGQIHLWCAFFDEIREEPLLREYRSLLTPAERSQEQRFHFARDRHRYLITRALVRTTLSRYVPLAAADWIFSNNAHGRPEIANDDARASRITFNVSHTNSLIILGVASDCALGVDTENVRSREASIDIADRFFSPEEASELRALPQERQQQRFFEYWTLKESYIKARGMGLSIPLDHFGFRFRQAPPIEIWIDQRQNDDPSRWAFWQFWPTQDYLVAICAERTEGDAELMIRKVVPLRSQERMEITPLRAYGDWRLS